ncbi:ImmA/IrrE family metallo-endopeptidase [Litchfieldia salsa]|uniref:IrrE N-terminal-like domain-containing protein n=1 Tax=Litchfieldia salsa TaxID=930152 RepID=A0A1H0VQH9_9BACI|nr:ImmA/IrrE family metallo-endopeptidase [Litchfieldia salsa]SDP80438.1 protein of unknown function [Litchfieldia salsa]
MSYIYRPFEVEKWISRYYLKIGMKQPEEINEIAIARSFRIYLTYTEKRSFAHKEENFKLINIDSRLTKFEQREHFFHELCHILRHCGYQIMMPKSFRELQEFDSKRFTRYAAIPFDMLNTIDLRSPYVVQNMADTFKVSEDLCRERLEGIHRNKKTKKPVFYT